MDAASVPKRYRRDPFANNPFAIQGNNNDGNGDNKDNNHEFIQRNYSTDIPTKIRFHAVTNLTKKRGNFLNNANNVLINGDCNATGVANNNTTNTTNTIGATGVANNKAIHLANTGIGLDVNNVIGIGLGAVLSPATTATTPRLNNGFDLFDAPTRGAFDTQRVGFDLIIYSLQLNFKSLSQESIVNLQQVLQIQ